MAEQDLHEMGQAARRACPIMALARTDQKNQALNEIAQALRALEGQILEANTRDVAAANLKGLKSSFIDRLTLTAQRVSTMAQGLEEIAALSDPVGKVTARWPRPNGLAISKVQVPIGVIAIIFESRPNVAIDAAGLIIKSGNVAILRGGSDSFHTVAALMMAVQSGLTAAGLPKTAVQAVPTSDRASVGLLLQGLNGTIDVIVPRGGKGLVARVQEEARVPVFSHLDGNCHVYVDHAADLEMAKAIVVNAKMRRTGVCGAAETILVDQAGGEAMLKEIIRALIEAGCAIRGDKIAMAADPRVGAAQEADWSTEYLDAIVALGVVDGVDQAIAHINRYGSHHTDAIITSDATTAERFLREVDSAIVVHNASTQFADGGEFGFGAEIGIATGRLHARGPVGVEQLTTFKYEVAGSGQIRP